MLYQRVFFILFVAVCFAMGQVAPVTVQVSNETTPPGGTAQIKVSLTSPQPIASGGASLDSSAGFSTVDGIALFSPTGDVSGAAVINSGNIDLRFTSPLATFGSTLDYPLVTITGRIPQNAAPGQKFPVSLAASSWVDLLGSSIPLEIKPGSITVGGLVSISNIVPGGGTLAAGSVISILGTGFSDKTKVRLSEIKILSTRFVSPNELRVTLRDKTMLDGARVQVTNPDNSSATYYSYLRTVPIGQSANPLLARTAPVFSLNTASQALLPSTIPRQIGRDFFTGLALQNPQQSPVDIVIEARSGSGDVSATAQLTLPPGTRMVREVSELLGKDPLVGDSLLVKSNHPVQTLGLLGNDRTGTVLPISLTILTPGPEPGSASKTESVQ